MDDHDTEAEHEWRDPRPFLFRHIRRVTLRLAADDPSQPLLWRPHPELESGMNPLENPSYRISKKALRENLNIGNYYRKAPIFLSTIHY
ncbi:hypothetical protein BAR24_10875 [Gluconobacter oxydans]|nr:hypothetical protein B932_3060 [Gluconobacter oxydans H24]ANQ41911.1 hypothetical protein BAR24_10875 [Gluconobacter oxydans]